MTTNQAAAHEKKRNQMASEGIHIVHGLAAGM
jgi:hypothetical protein